MALVVPLKTASGDLMQFAAGDYVTPANLGSGTADTTKALRGDSSWQTIPTILGYTPINKAGDTGITGTLQWAGTGAISAVASGSTYVGFSSGASNGNGSASITVVADTSSAFIELAAAQGAVYRTLAFLHNSAAPSFTTFDGVTLVSYAMWHAGNDGASSGLDSDFLDGQHGSYYQNASNLNAGTVSNSRIDWASPGAIGATTPNTGVFSALRSTDYIEAVGTYTLNAYYSAGWKRRNTNVPFLFSSDATNLVIYGDTASGGAGSAVTTNQYMSIAGATGKVTFAQNVGVAGTTPPAWSGVVPYAMHVRSSAVASATDNVNTYLTSNVYYNGSGWTYINTERGGLLNIAPATGGVAFNFYTTPSGTAGTTATLTNTASLSPAGDFWALTISPGALANWYLGVSSSNPYINLDTNDYITFNRTINRLSIAFGGTTYFYVDDNDIVYCANGVDGGSGPISTLSASGMTAPKHTSTVATGTQPYACTSTTQNTNLRAEYAAKFDATSHLGTYWLVNNWDGSRWQVTSNHGAAVRVGYADDAGTLGTRSLSESAAASSIAARNSGGYLFAVYFNMSGAQENHTADSYIYTQGSDGYLRRKTLANTQTEIVTSSVVNTAIGGLSTVNFKQNVNLVSDVGGAGTLYSSSIAGSTTANAANMVIDASGYYMQRSTSSARYKRNVQNATHGLAEVLQLRPVTYQGKGPLDGDKVHGGLIAEEVHALGLTEFVSYQGTLPDGLSYGPMVSLVVKAVQEEHANIVALTARVAALEAA